MIDLRMESQPPNRRLVTTRHTERTSLERGQSGAAEWMRQPKDAIDMSESTDIRATTRP